MRKTSLKILVVIIIILGCIFVGRRLVTIWRLLSSSQMGWEDDHYLWLTGAWGHTCWDVERQSITQSYAKPYNLAHFFVSVDNQVWAYGHGIWRFEVNKWIELYESTGQQYEMIHDMGQLADDTIWIATWSGFKFWNHEIQQWETMIVEQPGRTLVQAPDGSLWFGLLEDGVVYSKSGELTFWNTTNGLVHDQVSSMLVASDETVWIGTNAGVSHWDGKQWQNWTDLGYPDADGLAVSKLYETTDGVIWAATSADFAKWENGTWLTYERDPTCFTAYSLLESSDGSLWAGCAGGLFRWDTSTWREYGKGEGVANNAGCRLLLGGDDVLYASTESGVYYYVPQQDYWHSILDMVVRLPISSQ